jgi:hypothetical protein
MRKSKTSVNVHLQPATCILCAEVLNTNLCSHLMLRHLCQFPLTSSSPSLPHHPYSHTGTKCHSLECQRNTITLPRMTVKRTMSATQTSSNKLLGSTSALTKAARWKTKKTLAVEVKGRNKSSTHSPDPIGHQFQGIRIVLRSSNAARNKI